MLQVTNLEKSYGKQLLFDGVSFTVNPRERVGLVGRNGHGKSTLFRMILGEEHQDSEERRMEQAGRGHPGGPSSALLPMTLTLCVLHVPVSVGRNEKFQTDNEQTARAKRGVAHVPKCPVVRCRLSVLKSA